MHSSKGLETNSLLKTMLQTDYPMKHWTLEQKLIYKGIFVYNWFSNFAPSPMIIDDKEWQTVESYFQAMKSLVPEEQEVIRLANPGKAKKLGRQVKLRSDWEEVKVEIMRKALLAKWSQPKFKEQLLATGDFVLVEWNNWSDSIWGVPLDKQGKPTRMGRNILGILLMEIRESFKEQT